MRKKIKDEKPLYKVEAFQKEKSISSKSDTESNWWNELNIHQYYEACTYMTPKEWQQIQ
ncbi:MAG: hypothetical protein N4A72_22785 [Bacteroidales bacterium]|jgi:hypothetical protein|nr:hypothetical protein [Bacteroidales bacterium]